MDSNIMTMQESKLGIASIICMITTIVLVILGFVFSGIGVIDYNYGLLIVGGLFILMSLTAACGGIVTGTIGCCQSNCKKVTAIVGLSVNALIFLLVVILLIAGCDMPETLS